MFEPFPLGLGGGRRSDRHGVTERHTTLALSRPFLDPRDIAADGAVACWRSRRTRLERSQCGPCGAVAIERASANASRQNRAAHYQYYKRTVELGAPLRCLLFRPNFSDLEWCG